MSVEQIQAWQNLIILAVIPLVTIIVGVIQSYLSWKRGQETKARDIEAVKKLDTTIVQNDRLERKADIAIVKAEEVISAVDGPLSNALTTNVKLAEKVASLDPSPVNKMIAENAAVREENHSASKFIPRGQAVPIKVEVVNSAPVPVVETPKDGDK